MPIGFVRPWKGIDLTDEKQRAANLLKSLVQRCRNEWLKIRLKHALYLNSARVEAPRPPSGPGRPEAIEHAVHNLLHKLSQDMRQTTNQAGAIKVLKELDETYWDPSAIPSGLHTQFRGCRAIQLQQLRTSIEDLHKLLADNPVNERQLALLVKVHGEVDRFLMVKKRYGHSELGSRNQPTPNEEIRPATVLDENGLVSDADAAGSGDISTDGADAASHLSDLEQTEPRLQNSPLTVRLHHKHINVHPSVRFETSSEENSPPDGLIVFLDPSQLENPDIGPSLDPSEKSTSRREDFKDFAAPPRSPPHRPSLPWQSGNELDDADFDEADGADSSSEDRGTDELEELPPPSRGHSATAILSKLTVEGSGSVRRNAPLAEMVEDAPAKEPPKAVPIGATWTKEMSEQELSSHSRKLMGDLFAASNRLEAAPPQRRGPVLRTCFHILNQLADPVLAPYRSDNANTAFNKSIPELAVLSQAMRALRAVVNDVPREKQEPSRAILREWDSLVATDRRLTKTVADPRILFKSAVMTAIGEADFEPPKRKNKG